MSDRVNQLIDEVREKALRLKDSLSTERSRIETLEDEVTTLKATISKYESDLKIKVDEIASLRNDMNSMKIESIPAQNESGFNDEQIDELVKEIEYCIAKLKQE